MLCIAIRLELENDRYRWTIDYIVERSAKVERRSTHAENVGEPKEGSSSDISLRRLSIPGKEESRRHKSVSVETVDENVATNWRSKVSSSISFRSHGHAEASCSSWRNLICPTGSNPAARLDLSRQPPATRSIRRWLDLLRGRFFRVIYSSLVRLYGVRRYYEAS